MARIDYDLASSSYDRGRALPANAFSEWHSTLAEMWPFKATGAVLNIGAGTGIWLELLAGWFSERVIGIEPAAGIRDAAVAKALPLTTDLVGADAAALPIADHSCKVAWLSTVIHHIADLDGCAAELHRVLNPGGLVLIRSSFPNRHDEIPLFRFFPGAQRIASTFPTVEATIDTFGSAGFEYVTLRRVREAGDSTMADMIERVRAMRTADSTLAPLSDEEFASGMSALESAAASMKPVPPIGLDLLVLQASRRLLAPLKTQEPA
jgi:ubiquinone/menaquinone biosynthesis C-methylase UbiE